MDRGPDGRYQPGHNLPGPGRPSLYDPSMNEQAYKLALLGLTDEQIASFFGIATSTVYDWMNEFPAFSEAVNNGKTPADAEVAASLYRRAMGEVTFVERRVRNSNGEYEIIRLSQSVPADVTAAKMWLVNRQPELWRDRRELVGGPEKPLVQAGTASAELLSILSAIAGRSEK